MPRNVSLIVDAEVLGAPRSGIGVYLEQVLEHLDPGFQIHKRASAASGGAERARLKQLVRRVPGAYSVRRTLIGWPPVPDDAVFFAPNFLLPPWPLVRGRAAITVHDLVFFDHPEWADRTRGRVLRQGLGASIARADAIIVTNRAMKDALHARFGCGDKTRVIGLGIRQLMLPERTLEDVRPIVAVGNFEPRKDPLTLLHAHRALPPALRRAHPLWLCGQPLDPAYARRLTLALDPPCSRIEPDMLFALAHAAVCVQPSVAEGYGLVPLEALGAGVPVVASDLAITRELCSDLASYFPPGDAATLARVLEHAVASPRPPSERERRALLTRHDWREVGHQHSELFRELAVT